MRPQGFNKLFQESDITATDASGALVTRGVERESLVLGTEAKSDPVSSYTTLGLFMWLVLFSRVCWGRLICFHINACRCLS